MKEISKILNSDEKIVWEGTPSFWPYLFGSSLPTTIFGIFWSIFMIPIVVMAINDILFGSHFVGFGIFLLPHFWIGIIMVVGIPTYQVLAYKHTYYYISDKRVIVQSGLIGRDFKIVDFDKIADSEVNVGIFDSLITQGTTGNIQIESTSMGTKKQNMVLRSIANPYEVFKLFKKVSPDVKTDINYPNDLRPAENSGYNTKYTHTQN